MASNQDLEFVDCGNDLHFFEKEEFGFEDSRSFSSSNIKKEEDDYPETEFSHNMYSISEMQQLHDCQNSVLTHLADENYLQHKSHEDNTKNLQEEDTLKYINVKQEYCSENDGSIDNSSFDSEQKELMNHEEITSKSLSSFIEEDDVKPILDDTDCLSQLHHEGQENSSSSDDRDKQNNIVRTEEQLLEKNENKMKIKNEFTVELDGTIRFLFSYENKYFDLTDKDRTEEKSEYNDVTQLALCLLCDIYVPLEEEQQHFENFHQDGIFFICPLCNNSIMKPKDQFKHETCLESKCNKLKCCGKQFLTWWSLIEHISDHHPNQVDLSCRQCSYQADSYKQLVGHVLKYHRENCFIKKCKDCDFRTLNPMRLDAHIRNIHTSYKCPNCNFSSTTKRDINLHIKLGHCTQTSKYVLCGKSPCPFCKGRFKNNRCLLHHLNRRHKKLPRMKEYAERLMKEWRKSDQ